MRNIIRELKINVTAGELGSQISGNYKVITQGSVGKIRVHQNTEHAITGLPKNLQLELTEAINRIEEYLNSVEVSGGEVTMATKAKKGKAKPELPEQPEDEFIELDPEDYLQD